MLTVENQVFPKIHFEQRPEPEISPEFALKFGSTPSVLSRPCICLLIFDIPSVKGPPLETGTGVTFQQAVLEPERGSMSHYTKMVFQIYLLGGLLK